MTDHTRVLPVHIPSIAFKGATTTDAKAFRRAAQNLDEGYSIGGSNLKAAISGLLRCAADALDAAGEPDPEWSYWEYQQRQWRRAD
ncbi:hypothetical protein [Mycolicibacterium houstonense]|uniref:hypothetical protein n=1 Tax=Mycolicibacterium houstonense TaxID=146021 RepID=UPI000836B632|nr:hypothetical protein [Mycolicibacterium houstonense]